MTDQPKLSPEMRQEMVDKALIKFYINSLVGDAPIVDQMIMRLLLGLDNE